MLTIVYVVVGWLAVAIIVIGIFLLESQSYSRRFHSGLFHDLKELLIPVFRRRAFILPPVLLAIATYNVLYHRILLASVMASLFFIALAVLIVTERLKALSHSKRDGSQ